jgi:hypothetical protein
MFHRHLDMASKMLCTIWIARIRAIPQTGSSRAAHDCTIQSCRTGLGREVLEASIGVRVPTASSSTNEREATAAISQSPHGGASEGCSPPLAVGRRTWGWFDGVWCVVVVRRPSLMITTGQGRGHRNGTYRHSTERGGRGEEGPLPAHIPPLLHPGEERRDPGGNRVAQSLPRCRLLNVSRALRPFPRWRRGSSLSQRARPVQLLAAQAQVSSADVANATPAVDEVHINLLHSRNEALVAWSLEPGAWKRQQSLHSSHIAMSHK